MILFLFLFHLQHLSGAKNRPALILINSDFDVTVTFITTQLKWQDSYDVKLEPSTLNGLKKTSLIRLSKITTVDKDLVIGKLGSVTDAEIKQVNRNLIELLDLK